MPRLFATAPRCAESVLCDELRELGVEEVREVPAGVGFGGELGLAYRVCLWSRVASRVLLEVAEFPAEDADALYRAVRDIDWSAHLDVRSSFAVDCTIRGSSSAIQHSRFAALRVKDAVVDQMRERFGARPDVDVERPDVRLHLHLDRARGVLSIDLAGESLHRRGYRRGAGPAPLKENLAAAVLRRARWPEFARRGLPLLDPMCGAGTLVIEAASMVAGRAPGLGRDYFGFLGWKGHDPSLWAELVRDAKEGSGEAGQGLPEIIGYDADPQAVAAARANVAAAGLGGIVKIEREALDSCPSPAPKGLMVVNPPYGKRMGDEQEAEALHALLGDKLCETFPEWDAAVFTGAPEHSGRLLRRIRRRHRFFNGAIPCELLCLDALSEEAKEKRSRPPAEPVEPSPFANRVQKNQKRLRPWIEREKIECYRLYDADIPEFAVAVDRYGDWVHIQEYAAPDGVDPAKAAARLAAVSRALPDLLKVPADHVVTKTRSRQRGKKQYERLDSTRELVEVRDGPARLLVNLHDYLDTGLFLDHRPTRELIGQLAHGGRFLNLFCYTASANAHAGLGGAAATVGVDLSRTYLEWGRRNLDLNHLPRTAHELLRADVMPWLDAYRGPSFDLVFCDPPTFSNSKRMASSFEVERDQAELLRAAMRVVTPGGTLIFSTNKRRFKLTPELAERYEVEDITRRTVPPDYARSPRVHLCWKFTHRAT